MTKWNGRIYIRSRKYIYEFQRLSYYKSMNYIHEKFSKASPCPQCSVFDKQIPFLISCNHVNFCPKKTRHVIVCKLTFFLKTDLLLHLQGDRVLQPTSSFTGYMPTPPSYAALLGTFRRSVPFRTTFSGRTVLTGGHN